MNKPLSAVDLLEQIDNILGEEIDATGENILDKLIDYELLQPEANITLEMLLMEAQRLSVLRSVRSHIRQKYKHVELQAWSHDNEVV